MNQADEYVAIQRLFTRYAAALDNRSASEWLECMAPESRNPQQVEGGIALHRKFAYTVHINSNFSYDIQGDVAKGGHYCRITYVNDRNGTLTKFDVFSRYHDMLLIKKDGRWYMKNADWTPLFSSAEVPVSKDVPPGFWDVPASDHR